jgi:undecaprenyl-diphosphatase
LVAVLIGGIAFYHDRGSNAADNWMGYRTLDLFSHRTLVDLLNLTTPRWVIRLDVAVFGLLLVLRRFGLAAVAAIGPGAAFVLTEWVVKPVVHRTYASPIVINGREVYLYPSGHETGIACLTAVLVLALYALTSSRLVLAVAALAAGVLDFLAAAALVGNGFHFATDTIAAVCVSLACVLGAGLGVDALVARRTARDGRG